MAFFFRQSKNDECPVPLNLRYAIKAEDASDGIETLFYDIILNNGLKVGHIDLRIGMNEEMYYYGNVGYWVGHLHRGHHYAYYACIKLFDIAKEEYGLDKLIITCSPDNIPSYKTLIHLGGKLKETVAVPYNHELYKCGETVKCIFEFKL